MSITLQEYNYLFPNDQCKIMQNHPFEKEGMILFSRETSHNLAGSFNHYGYYSIIDYRTYKHYLSYVIDLKSIENLKQEIKLCRFNFDCFKFNFEEDAKDDEHLRIRLSNITKKDRIYWENSFKYRLENITEPTKEFPVRFYLAGNDNSTWVKFYASVELAINEFKEFELFEPIDFNSFIKEYNLIFNN